MRIKETYILNAGVTDMFKEYAAKECFYADMLAMDCFLKEHDVHGFTLKMNERIKYGRKEIAVVLTIQPQFKETNRENFDRLNINNRLIHKA